MDSYSVVVLTRGEREVFGKVLHSIGIAFPDYTTRQERKGDHDADLTRALFGLGKDGSAVTHSMLTRAREALERQVAQCAIEADVEHWRRTLLRPAPQQGCPVCAGTGESERCVADDGGFDPAPCPACNGHRRVDAPAPAHSSALVLDPEQMCEYLAEARTLQLREAQRALALCNQALTLATPPPNVRSDLD